MKLKLDFLNEEAAKLAISFSMGVFRIEEHDGDVRFSVKFLRKNFGVGCREFLEKNDPSYRKSLRAWSRLKNNVRIVLFSPGNGSTDHFHDEKPTRQKFDLPRINIYKIEFVSTVFNKETSRGCSQIA